MRRGPAARCRRAVAVDTSVDQELLRSTECAPTEDAVDAQSSTESREFPLQPRDVGPAVAELEVAPQRLVTGKCEHRLSVDPREDVPAPHGCPGRARRRRHRAAPRRHDRPWGTGVECELHLSCIGIGPLGHPDGARGGRRPECSRDLGRHSDHDGDGRRRRDHHRAERQECGRREAHHCRQRPRGSSRHCTAAGSHGEKEKFPSSF